MNPCIYTGAIVHFADHGAFAVADIFEVPGGAILVQWMPESWTYARPNEITHRVLVNGGYHHDKRGVTVVAADNFQGPRR